MPPLPGIRLAELHPIVVHFPIALLIASVALDFASPLVARWRLTDAATWCLILGTPAAAVALLSGWLSEHDVRVEAAGALLHLHKLCAFSTVAVFGLLLALRLIWLLPRGLALPRLAAAGPVARFDGWLRVQLPGLYAERLPAIVVTLYLALSVVGVVLLAATGYLGGAIVYDHGVGMP